MSNELHVITKGILRGTERTSLLESAFWLSLSLLVSGKAIIEGLLYPNFRDKIVETSYASIALSIILLIFPLFFSLIFGRMPLQATRQFFKRLTSFGYGLELNSVSVGNPTSTVDDESSRVEQKGLRLEEIFFSQDDVDSGSTHLSEHDAPARLRTLSRDSRSIARRLFTRAGIYLLVGTMIAATGLIFFYAQSSTIVPAADLIGALIQLGPRFGILFFIEFFAFFFLRQYRGAMDEFRYYEAIARSREEMTVAYAVLSGRPSAELAAAFAQGAFSSKVAALAPGHSTEALEAKRIEGSDLAGLAKILEGLAAFKK